MKKFKFLFFIFVFVLVSNTGFAVVYDLNSGTDVYVPVQYSLYTLRDFSYKESGNVGSNTASQVNDVQFNSDGTKVFVSDSAGDISSYETQTAWNVDNLSYLNTYDLMSSKMRSFTFSPNGNHLYAGSSGSNEHCSWDLSNPYDLSSSSRTKLGCTNNSDPALMGGNMTSNGDYLYQVQNRSSPLREFHLTDSWDASTSSYDFAYPVSSSSSSKLSSVFPTPKGDRFIFLWEDGIMRPVDVENFYEYESNWESPSIEEVNLNDEKLVGDVRGLTWGNDKRYFYVVDKDNHRIRQFTNNFIIDNPKPTNVEVTDGLRSVWSFENTNGNGRILEDNYNGDGSRENGSNSSLCIYQKSNVKVQNIAGDYSCVNKGSTVSKSSFDFSNNFTIVTWVHYDASNVGVPFSTSSTSDNVGIEIATDSGDFLGRIWGSDNTKYENAYSVSSDTWYHVAIVGDYGSNDFELYVNGTNVVTNSSWDGTIAKSSYDIGIGDRAQDSAYEHNDLIDDVRIYEKALTSTQIQTIYNNTK